MGSDRPSSVPEAGPKAVGSSCWPGETSRSTRPMELLDRRNFPIDRPLEIPPWIAQGPTPPLSASSPLVKKRSARQKSVSEIRWRPGPTIPLSGRKWVRNQTCRPEGIDRIELSARPNSGSTVPFLDLHCDRSGSNHLIRPKMGQKSDLSARGNRPDRAVGLTEFATDRLTRDSKLGRQQSDFLPPEGRKSGT